MVAALNCPACHDTGYEAVAEDEVAPCTHPDHVDRIAAIQAMTAEDLVASIPNNDTFGTQRWAAEIGIHLTPAQWYGVRDLLRAELGA